MGLKSDFKEWFLRVTLKSDFCLKTFQTHIIVGSLSQCLVIQRALALHAFEALAVVSAVPSFGKMSTNKKWPIFKQILTWCCSLSWGQTYFPVIFSASKTFPPQRGQESLFSGSPEPMIIVVSVITLWHNFIETSRWEQCSHWEQCSQILQLTWKWVGEPD